MSTREHLPYRTPNVPKGYGGFRWPAIIVGLFFVVLSNVAATQWIAYRFHYAAALGHPLARAAGVLIYAPWNWIPWFLHYGKSNLYYVKMTVNAAILVAVMGSVVSCLGVVAQNFRRTKKLLEGGEDLHGSARFATKQDLLENGMLATSEGVYMGAFRESDYVHYLQDDSKSHVLAFAPTRSGKGVGLVVPTMLGWKDSVIVNDLKEELWTLTSGWRAKELGQTCLKFAPLSRETCHLNPFDLVRFGTDREVADCQNVAEQLIDVGEKVDDRYFLDEAINLAAAQILHLFYEAKRYNYATPSPATLLDLAADAGMGIVAIMEILKSYPHRGEGDAPFPGIPDTTLTTHPFVASGMATMLAKGDREFGSVLGSLTRPLRVFADPIVRAATNYSDFTIADLVSKPVSLYMCIPNSDKMRLRGLIRVLYTMTVNRLTEKMDFSDGMTKANPYRLLLMVDEFPSLGRMQIFSDALSYMAGYGLKAYLITQDVRQIIDAYGAYESIISNCQTRIAFAPANQETAELLSSMTGKRTIQQATVNFSGNRTSSVQNQMSTSISYVKRELLTADEVSTKVRPPRKVNAGRPEERIIGPGDSLIFQTGSCGPAARGPTATSL